MLVYAALHNRVVPESERAASTEFVAANGVELFVRWFGDPARFSSDWNAPYATGQLRPGVPDNAENVLKNWARPILILQGVHDMGFPVSLARKLHAALPASTLAEIPDAAHMAHFDNPQAWLASIRGFLNAAR